MEEVQHEDEGGVVEMSEARLCVLFGLGSHLELEEGDTTRGGTNTRGGHGERKGGTGVEEGEGSEWEQTSRRVQLGGHGSAVLRRQLQHALQYDCIKLSRAACHAIVSVSAPPHTCCVMLCLCSSASSHTFLSS